ncbi:hypothetical protein WS105_0688 [Weissella ceti]|uniref:Uncharacterized protein n=2 Tax=Weissella TaxID=46255 RepID=A0A075TZ39_9LACO|nr:hypothetical protein WS08_0627 [Weissella tructae]AIM62880.1 hypothetical protein WS74_0628 [Weissella ceti]AIM64278.1 hypothetical protein WS105_0688 [Weissella ceti]
MDTRVKRLKRKQKKPFTRSEKIGITGIAVTVIQTLIALLK